MTKIRKDLHELIGHHVRIKDCIHTKKEETETKVSALHDPNSIEKVKMFKIFPV